MPIIPKAVNHIAYPTFDTAATHRFYTEVLGCKLVAAIREDHVPSTGAQTPFLHTFFALESGECLAFFEVEGIEPPTDDGLPTWIRHVALSVGSPAELTRVREQLLSRGVQVTDEIDHEGTWSSIYFFDPNGIRIELTYQSRDLNDDDATRAHELINAWLKEHSTD